jgi:fructokinase
MVLLNVRREHAASPVRITSHLREERRIRASSQPAFGWIFMILAIGEILYDIFPDHRRLGGAPFNFAFHLKKIGLRVRLVSRVGNDADGRRIRTVLADHRFETESIQIDRHHPTGRVRVQLDEEGVPTFDIVADVAYDYLAFDTTIARLLENCTLIYFGSLIQRTTQGFNTLQRILSRRRPQTRCFYDVNFRPNGYNERVVRESLRHTDVLKLNEEELDILKQFHTWAQPTDQFVRWLMQHYGIEQVALTRGAAGSVLFSGSKTVDMMPPPLEATVDTVGAGDAFASILAVGFLRQWPAQKTLTAASALAARICGVAGAVPDDMTPYDEILSLLRDEDDGR